MRWWFFRSKAAAPETKTAEPSSQEAVPPHSAAARLLDLQQSVGNQAVQRMITESSLETEETVQSHTAHTGGEALPQDVRENMEARFGEDFRDVRVHADDAAATTTTALDAGAYTIGRDVYFARGMYAPQDPEGQRLIAHELTHVVQQKRAGGVPALQNEVSEPIDSSEREAEAVAQRIERNEPIPTVVSPGEGLQRDVGWARRGPLADPYGEILLLNSFAAKFLEAAKLIYKNPAAMKLVDEAEVAGVQFGGYAEDGPAKAIGRAYTVGNTVYVPKTRTDPFMAMRSFLFELNNGIRAPKFAELTNEATKGIKGTLTAKQYAYQMLEQEVEGMLRLGEIWLETKKTMPKGPKTDVYDVQFYLSDYEAVRGGKKTKDDLVKEVMKRVYDNGTLKGKTHEQYYMEYYEQLSGAKWDGVSIVSTGTCTKPDLGLGCRLPDSRGEA